MKSFPRDPPVKSHRYHIAFIAVIVLAGVALSLALYRYNVRTRAAYLEEEFSRRAEIRHALTREIVNDYVSAIYSLKNLFDGSESVRRPEFHRVAQDILKRYRGIAALEWAPIVSRAERPGFETQVYRETGRSFQFTEPGPGGTMVRAHDRPEHIPIVYVEPLAGNERAFGYDLQTATTKPFLERARQSGQLVLTPQFQLIQSHQGVVMICPLVRPVTAPGAEEKCVGFVQVVFRVNEMLEQAQGMPALAIDALFVDDSATTAAERRLYYRPAGEPPATAEAVSEEAFRRGLHREYVVELGGRRWLALYRPGAVWLAAQRSTSPELWLTAGFLITALLAALVGGMVRHAWAVEREVAARTAELDESRRQLDGLLHALPGMAFRGRYDGESKVLFVSEGALGLTGWASADFISGAVHFRDLIHPDDLARVRTATRAALEQKRTFEVEYRIRVRNGDEKWVLARGGGVFERDGSLRFAEGLAIDITARKLAEADKLEVERKLLESQRRESLGMLAGGIAHDFNNLLAAIMGRASLARQRPGVDPTIAEHLRRIENTATRAAELCQQMLAYSGRGRFQIEPLDLAALVRDTVAAVKTLLPPQAELELVLDPQPIAAMADATQIRQILSNLILNAADALGATGGRIVVTSGARSFDRDFFAAARVGDTLAAGDYVFIEVRDTGTGMTPETLAKIFDPFFSTKFTGRGLGLAAVLGVIRGHGGALRVTSESGRGSTFTIVLPPSPEAPTPDAAAVSAIPWHGTGTVLVIDDEDPVRDIACELIHSFGLRVVPASNGADGVAHFRQNPAGIDLILLDLTMPGLSGEETLAALREISPDVKVLLVSGYSDSEHINRLSAGGRLVFMQKPYTRAKLEANLRAMLA